MGFEAEPGTFLADDLNDLLLDAPDATMPAVIRGVLGLGRDRVPIDDPRLEAAAGAIAAGRAPAATEARGLRALARELDDARDAAPDDVGAWERAEIGRAFVRALDADPCSGAYDATHAVHRAVDDHPAVLAAVGAAVAPPP